MDCTRRTGGIRRDGYSRQTRGAADPRSCIKFGRALHAEEKRFGSWCTKRFADGGLICGDIGFSRCLAFRGTKRSIIVGRPAVFAMEAHPSRWANAVFEDPS